jgi:hypothetical protein
LIGIETRQVAFQNLFILFGGPFSQTIVDHQFFKGSRMKLGISDFVPTSLPKAELLDILRMQFQTVAPDVRTHKSFIEVHRVEATLGSIIRRDKTAVWLQRRDNGWLIFAHVHYRPSVYFWTFVLAGLFSLFFWIVPVWIYYAQKKSVKLAVESCLKKVKSQLLQAAQPHHSPENLASSEQKLQGDQRVQGVISEDDVTTKMKQLQGRVCSISATLA